MAIGLFNDKKQKGRQDIMILHPSSLSPLVDDDDEFSQTLQRARDSTLMDPSIIKHMINQLTKGNEEMHKLSNPEQFSLKMRFSLLLKGIAYNLETLGQEFIDLLRKEGVLDGLMTFLYQDIEKLAKENTPSSTTVIPINWLEGKIENMRKMAIESNKSISVECVDIKVQILAKKELIIKRTDPMTMNVSR